MRRSLLFVALLGAALSTPAEAREFDGATVYKDNCSRCHQPRTPADLSVDGWRAASFHMRVTANLTLAEFNALEAFLEPAPPSETSGSSILEGNPIAARVCTTCHDTQRISAAVSTGRTEAQWQATLTRMRTYGAPISADEADDVAAWLASLPAEPAQ